MKNRTFFTGNITHDIELRRTGSGKAVTEFSIAVNEGFGDNEKANFFRIIAWENHAENIAKFFKKGRPISVECKAKVESWEDKKTGDKRESVKFTIIDWEFPPGGLQKKKDDENTDSDDDDVEEEVKPAKKTQPSKPASKPAPAKTEKPAKATPKQQSIEDDDDSIEF